MPKILENRWGVFGWGVFASVLLHLTVAAFFFVKLPEQPPTPPEEETLNVDLVPPPEEKKPEEKKPEEPKPALKVPEEPTPEEKKAEEKAEEKKAEEKAAEKPAEPPKAEAKAEEPPPPPPPPPEQPKPPEEKPPEVKAPEEKPPEETPKPEQSKPEEQGGQATGEQGKPQPLQPLRPVFEFGDKNTGPQKSETGDASAVAAKPDETPPSDEPEPKPAETPTAVKPPVEDKPPGNPVPDDIELPQVAAVDSHHEKNGPAAEAIGEVKTDFEQAKPPEAAKSEAKEPAKPVQDALTEAKTLFSRNATDDPVAKTAMDNLPRGMRVAQLCTTELREQLRHSPSGYRPELLPSYRLSSGTVLEVRRGAFRAGARWYDMSFRCEVDADATKVMSFAFNVGDQVPKSQWKSRGFPQ
jgi:hypothetical protein